MPRARHINLADFIDEGVLRRELDYITVKLSDNLAKATGRAEDIERFKRIFGYTGENYEECRYLEGVRSLRCG